MANMAALRIFSYLTLGQVLLSTISRCLNFSSLRYRAMKMAISNVIFEETKVYSKIVLTSADLKASKKFQFLNFVNSTHGVLQVKAKLKPWVHFSNVIDGPKDGTKDQKHQKSPSKTLLKVVDTLIKP